MADTVVPPEQCRHTRCTSVASFFLLFIFLVLSKRRSAVTPFGITVTYKNLRSTLNHFAMGHATHSYEKNRCKLLIFTYWAENISMSIVQYLLLKPIITSSAWQLYLKHECTQGKQRFPRDAMQAFGFLKAYFANPATKSHCSISRKCQTNAFSRTLMKCIEFRFWHSIYDAISTCDKG